MLEVIACLIESFQGVVTLLQHPSQLEEFKKDASLAKAVVNECLRYNTASALNSRRAAKEDITVGGKVPFLFPITRHSFLPDG